jgi:sigma-B regulation protein RsbU (phosphoserine phosphatase)
MLGDVSGKGFAAAPLMGFIHGAVHTSSWADSPLHHELATARLNELLHRKTAMDRFVTLFWGYFERDASRFRYVNAGHCPPVLFRARGRGNALVPLEEGGPVLGAIPGVEYRQGEVRVEQGDLLVMCSDGILEAANAAGEEFAEARILAAVRSHWEGSPADIRDAILTDLRRFRDGIEAHDDQTLVVVRFHPRETEASEIREAEVPVPAV